MEDSIHPRVFVFSVIIGVLLLFLVVGAFFSAKNRTGTIVLPGGITYLGPTPTKKIEKSKQIIEGKIPIPADTKWAEKKGAIFPYSFSYPESLSLGIFPNDPHDAVTIFYDGTDSNANIFFRVENLTTLKKTQYVGKTEEYANHWWKDYGWKGVTSVSEFTNDNGLKGYRAAYINDQNKTPYDHVFFEIPASPNANQGGPDRNDLIIWLSGKLFSKEDFDKLVESVDWKN